MPQGQPWAVRGVTLLALTFSRLLNRRSDSGGILFNLLAYLDSPIGWISLALIVIAVVHAVRGGNFLWLYMILFLPGMEAFLLGVAAASSAFCYLALANIRRRDF